MIGRVVWRAGAAVVLVAAAAIADVLVLFAPAGALLPATDVAILAAAALVAFAVVLFTPEQWVLATPAAGAGAAIAAAVYGAIDLPANAAVFDAQGGLGLIVVGAGEYAVLVSALILRGAIRFD